MLPSAERLSSLVLSIYAAASVPEKWPSFLKSFTELANGANAAILVNDYDHRQYVVAGSHNMDPEAQRLYSAHYGAMDVYWTEGKHLLRTGWCGVGQQLVPDPELISSEYYNDFQKVFDMFHMCMSALEVHPRAVSALTLLRPKRKNAFGNQQVELVKFLTPHLQLAIVTHRKMVDLRMANQNLQTAIDMLPTGIILLGSRGEILAANRAASVQISRNDGLLARRTGLHAEDPSESAELAKLITAAGATANGKSLRGGGGVLVSRRNGRPLRVLIAPVPAIALDLSRPVRAIAFVTDPEQRVRPRSEIMAAFFRLTPAECRLALLLADGRSLSEVTHMLGVTRNTLKTQLASVYAKTGTARQSELLRLLLSLPLETGESHLNR